MNPFFRSLAARFGRRRVTRPVAPPRRRSQLALETLESRTVLSPFGFDLLPPAALDGLRPADLGREDGGLRTAGEYQTSVIARGLTSPTGITLARQFFSNSLLFTQVPEPGVGGGGNTVSRLSLNTGRITTLDMGDPEPTNLVQDEFGNLYWTCKSAGVIVWQSVDGDSYVIARGLEQPTGLALDPTGRYLYYTELPTPGVPGSQGGTNRVSQLDLLEGGTTLIDAGDPEPTDVAVAANGDLYWTCRSAGVIVRYDAATGQAGVILRGLNQPVGIALDPQGQSLYFTELPTPGVPGSKGGTNRVSRFDLGNNELTVVDSGDPEPTDVTVGPDGTVYWTCTSAGVIVAAVRVGGAPGGGSRPGPGSGGKAGPEEGILAERAPPFLTSSAAAARHVRAGESAELSGDAIQAVSDAAGRRGRELYFAEFATPRSREAGRADAVLTAEPLGGLRAADNVWA